MGHGRTNRTVREWSRMMQKVRYNATRPLRYLLYGAAIVLGALLAFLSPSDKGKTGQLISDTAHADIPYAQAGYAPASPTGDTGAGAGGGTGGCGGTGSGGGGTGT